MSQLEQLFPQNIGQVNYYLIDIIPAFPFLAALVLWTGLILTLFQNAFHPHDIKSVWKNCLRLVARLPVVFVISFIIARFYDNMLLGIAYTLTIGFCLIIAYAIQKLLVSEKDALSEICAELFRSFGMTLIMILPLGVIVLLLKFGGILAFSSGALLILLFPIILYFETRNMNLEDPKISLAKTTQISIFSTLLFMYPLLHKIIM